MGSDNIFHKRKARNAKTLQRRAAQRAPYKKILIVCEGEKTEPNYFSQAREHYELNTVNVEIRGDCGSDPMSIVNFAKKRYREAEKTGDRFDEIYCVFDKDGHTNYAVALNTLTSAKPINTYFAIYSVPCFEYWLLLHFEDSTRPYNSCNQVLTELKKHMSQYKKNQQGIFTDLISQLDKAKKNAEKALQENRKNQTDNPSTYVHQLIHILQNLKNQRT